MKSCCRRLWREWIKEEKRYGTFEARRGNKASKFRVLLEDESEVNAAREVQDGSRSTDKTPKPK